MGVRVLGPVEVDEGPISPRERIVLSVLVARSGEVASLDELADALWPEQVASTWPKQVQATITRLRRTLGTRAIRTEAGGYRLDIDPDSIDAVRFERLVTAARGHALDGDPARAVDGFQRALALWRGRPYPDLAGWPPGAAEADRLAEIRSDVDEELAGERLRLGDHRAVIPEAERLVRESPLRESRWVLLATVLYRSGRQADALAAIRAARERLGDELGIDLGEELESLKLAILRHDPTLAPPDAPGDVSPACPYHGLHPFGVEDADDFFGRDADIAAALARLARAPFLAISGASGSGKSSLVRAGVVPALQRRGDRVAIFTPAHDVDIRVRDAAGSSGGADVIVIDQFEEVFHAGRSDVDGTATAIVDAVEAGTNVVVVVRSDFLDDCAAHPELARLVAEGVHLLGPMGPDALKAAIEEPARRAGLRLEPGLVEVIVRDAAGEPGALPHMSHALVETWLRREGATLTVAGYEASGGISGAIAQSADRLYQSMDATQRALCRSVLMRLVALAPDGSPVRRRAAAKPLRADAARDEVLAMLAGSRLVSAEADSVAVAHESLATAWPRLRSWLEEDAESARTLAAIAAAAETWNADGRPDDELYRGGRLQATIDWRETSSPDLTEVERDFLDASLDRDQSERRMEAERARRDRRQNLRLRWALIAAAALVVVTVIASAFVFVKSDEAEQSALDRQIEALTSTSLALRESDPGVAALLAAELHRRWPDDSRSYSALWGTVAVGDGLASRLRFAHGDRLVGAPIPGTRTAILVRDVSSDEGSRKPVVSIVDIDTSSEVRELPVEVKSESTWFPRTVRVSADGSVAAVQTSWNRDPDDPESCCLNFIDLIDLRSGDRLVDTIELDSRTGNAFAITPDGSRVALIHPITGELIVIDTATGRLLTPLPGPPEKYQGVEGRYTTVSIASDGTYLVGGPGSIIVHDPTTFEVIDRVELPDAMNEWVVLEVDDDLIFAAGMERLGLVDRRTGELRWQREVDPTTCLDAVVPPASGTLLCRDVPGTILEYDLATGQPTGRSFPSLSDWTRSLDLLDDDEFLTIAEREGPFLAHWRLDQAPSVTTRVAPGRMVVDGFGDGGRLVVTAPAGWRPEENVGGVQLWDVEADRPLGQSYDALVWADDQHAFAWHPDGDPTVVDVLTEESRSLPPLSEDGLVSTLSGGNGPLAFVVDGERVTAVDPGTGEAIGSPMVVPGVQLAQWSGSVAELGDGRRVAVNWFDPDELRMLTAMFDLYTGEELARGLADDGPVVATGEAELLSASTARLTRSDAELEALAALPTSGVAARAMQLTASEDLLLMDDWDNRLSLYDMGDARRLGTPLRVVAQDGQDFPASFISRDGTRIATNSEYGVLIWDIRPERLAQAACRLVGRELSELEWKAYFGEEPQVATCAWILDEASAAVDAEG
ncbi:DNA-binding SARP family transcriptional activator [Agromyces flavus]|uniref:DNA-binding SARP family transcriptional activator n=1 Tax=Agromyces flavus TaxID=589382 RepID=A0A1H1PHN0_9MICO|nr:BTAD domain-containing putative transcriptional regulator [Agromyces flavus]MCP2367919.1 DNA-binding SARP family transcriptional activator [Agromyces flavus]GGI47381.1 hypothetical protein GCM10010932_20690 [Agromyces flavus]SDS10623.1 DNA-binding transcriptional activator of the SARP family [Agromyces flavus]